jgi:2-dehydro-3-deoxygluconokinase
MLRTVAHHRTPLVLDINARPALGIGLKELRPAIAGAMIVKAAESDLDHYRLDPRRIGAPIVIVTRGERPATVWALDEGRFDVPVARAVPPAKIVDPVGAGDAFLAGVLACRLRGGNWTAALRLGHSLACAVVRTLGAQ